LKIIDSKNKNQVFASNKERNQIEKTLLRNIRSATYKKKSKLRVSSSLLKVAASVLILFSVFQVSRTLNDDIGDPVVFTNLEQENKEVVLSDGSKVTLNTNSSISFFENYKDNSQRYLTLKGEGFFKIKKNRTKPFIVKTNGLTTEVLGTEFNVKVQDVETVVTVSEGLVKVYSEKNDPLYVSPNNQVVFDHLKENLLLSDVNPALFTYWFHDDIVLKQIGIEEFIKVISSVYKIDRSQFVKNMKKEETLFTIAFSKNESLENVIKRYNYISNENQLTIKH